ncbi:flagellar basal body protein [Leptospira sp. WS92.C1]
MTQNKVLFSGILCILITIQPIFADELYSTEARAANSASFGKLEKQFNMSDEAKAIRNAHGANIDRLKSALKAVDLQIHWVTENLANANTPNYKKICITRNFPTLKTSVIPERDFGQGALTYGVTFDLALIGPGLFKLVDNQGQIIFRRLGSFKISSERYLVDLRGNILLPKIQIPLNIEEDTFSVSDQGIITMMDKNRKKIVIGAFQIFEPLLPEKLRYNEECDCFQTRLKDTDTIESALRILETVKIIQGYVEMSNVIAEEQLSSLFAILTHRTTLSKALRLLQNPDDRW